MKTNYFRLEVALMSMTMQDRIIFATKEFYMDPPAAIAIFTKTQQKLSCDASYVYTRRFNRRMWRLEFSYHADYHRLVFRGT